METFLTINAQHLDRPALIGVYEEFSTPLYRYAVRMLNDPDLAEECVAETFSRLLHAVRDGYGPRENVRAYLYRVAHNWITDHFRRNRLDVEQLDADLHADPQANPAHLIAREIERERVRQAVLSLPPDQRQVVELRFLEDWSHEEVATVLGKTVEATRALQHRAMAALRRLLKDQEE